LWHLFPLEGTIPCGLYVEHNLRNKDDNEVPPLVPRNLDLVIFFHENEKVSMWTRTWSSYMNLSYMKPTMVSPIDR
jgi:hypothetical protein